MLARSLERTGGAEEEGVRLFKDELREAVLKKNANRLGDFEDNDFYLVATLLDPRFKDSFFLSQRTGEQAREVLKQLVEAELEPLNGNIPEPQEVLEDAEEDGGPSILHSLRKRICRDRERQLGTLV